MSKSYGTSGYTGTFEGFDSGWEKSKKSTGGYKSCYHTHPKLEVGGGTLYGGSCISPIISDADIYIGLDSGMRIQEYLPWEREVQQILYPIIDMNVPSDPKTFAKLVEYVCNQLQAGKHVHAGCIGGHGRTGTLFAAIYSVINSDKDATTTVRKLYCKKVVESSAQINFLFKHFGINKVEATKESVGTGYNPSTFSSKSMKGVTDFWPKAGASEIKKSPTVFANASKVWNAVNSSTKAVGVLF